MLKVYQVTFERIVEAEDEYQAYEKALEDLDLYVAFEEAEITLLGFKGVKGGIAGEGKDPGDHDNGD